MVRVLKKADGTNDEGEDVDAAAELLVQAQAEISNKGSRGQLVLPLLSHRFHLGSPWDRWGFDDAFPMMLQDVLSYREWKVALEGNVPNQHLLSINTPGLCWVAVDVRMPHRARACAEINQGYTSSIWPKLVWVPFFFCLILGAVLEGVTQSAPQRSISVGLIVGAVAGSGLLTSLLLVWLSLNGIAQDMIRAEVGMPAVARLNALSTAHELRGSLTRSVPPGNMRVSHGALPFARCHFSDQGAVRYERD
jgi:hypothetical protein